MLRPLLIALILPGLHLLQTAVNAQESPARPGTQRLEYVATPARAVQAEDEALAPVTLINRADIERLQADSLTDLLRRSPGVAIANSGGPGKLTSLFLRGTESDHVLVLINGVRFGSATAGLAAFQDIPVEQIERIEIVRGPRSSLYGADAIGGVIQIFTRSGPTSEDTAFRPYFSASAGRYDSRNGQAGFSLGNRQRGVSLGLSVRETDGFNACDGRAPDPVSFSGGAGCFTDEPDDDPYSRVAGSARAHYRTGSGVELAAHALRSEADNNFDGSFNNESDTVQQVYGASLSGRLLQRLRSELAVGHSRDESDDFLDGDFVSRFQTQRDTATLQNLLSLAPGQELGFGLDYRHETVASTTDFDETERDNAGLYLQYLGQWGRHGIQLAARGDDDEQFGEQTTGSLSWGWQFKPRYRLTLSYGTAFKAPSFNDLYFPGFSNPALDPEESRSLEAGLNSRRDWGQWAVYVFRTEVDELIALDNNFIPQNISQTRLRGIETELGLTAGGWQLNANATWLDAENRADNANRGNELPRRPEYSAQLDADRRFGRFGLGAGLYLAGSRYDDLANARKLDSYQLFELRGSVQMSRDWQLQARLSNLTDEDYETVAFFNQPGRSVFLTVRYAPH